MSTLFISDLHLQEERPEITRAFVHFVEETARGADALYILGDFFEVWVGDDDASPLIETVGLALRRLNETGTAIYLQRGNRDFLLGEDFSTACGARLLPDSHRITPYGEPLLLMHGDQLCLEDTAYQAFRHQVRTPEWQHAFLAKPLAERHAIAAGLRQQSREQSRGKASEITDVTPAETSRVMIEARCTTLIHGHTHRPACHHFTLEGQPAERIVLGDWDHRGWYLQWRPDNSHTLHEFSI